MFDRLMTVLELVLLGVIVWQGQVIIRCEQGVYRIQKEREDERRQWREAKRRQQERKEAAKNLPEVSSPETTDRIHQE